MSCKLETLLVPSDGSLLLALISYKEIQKPRCLGLLITPDLTDHLYADLVHVQFCGMCSFASLILHTKNLWKFFGVPECKTRLSVRHISDGQH